MGIWRFTPVGRDRWLRACLLQAGAKPAKCTSASQ